MSLNASKFWCCVSVHHTTSTMLKNTTFRYITENFIYQLASADITTYSLLKDFFNSKHTCKSLI